MGEVGGERCRWLTNDQQLRAMLLESRCRVVQSVLFITVWLIMHYSQQGMAAKTNIAR